MNNKNIKNLNIFNNINTNIKTVFINNFISLNNTISICKQKKINIFVIKNNIVYFKKDSILNSLKNVKFDENSNLYIIDNASILNKTYRYLTIDDRKNIYYKGIIGDKKYNFDKNYRYYYNINKLLEHIETLKINNGRGKPNWKYRHHNNFRLFLKKSNIKYLDFNLNPFDLNWSVLVPTFVKSRDINDEKKTVLLPLEKLYIPSFYINILNDDIPFNKKLNNCVYRGTNSGDFFNNHGTKRQSRKELVLKYRFHEKFDIGLSDARYKNKDNVKFEYDIKKYVKKRKSIKEQLKYKFIISVEGNDFATNLSWILLSNSTVIMPKPTVLTWKIESELVPYVHYIPVKNDFSDLEEKFNWCLNNLDKCEKIAIYSKLYVLQFFDNEKEDKIITEVIKYYKSVLN